MKYVKLFEEFLNEFGHLYAPERGSGNANIKRVSYPVEKIKKGDKFTAIRDILGIKKGDKFEVIDIKTAREVGSIGNSLVFFVKINGRLNAIGKPFDMDQSDIELAIGK